MFKSKLPNYPNINFGRAVRLLSKLGYNKNDNNLRMWNDIYSSDVTISPILPDDMSLEQKRESSRVAYEYLDQYKHVFDKNKSKQIYLDMEKNNEFKIVDQITDQIRAAGGSFAISVNRHEGKKMHHDNRLIARNKKSPISSDKSINDGDYSF